MVIEVDLRLDLMLDLMLFHFSFGHADLFVSFDGWPSSHYGSTLALLTLAGF